MTGHLPDLAADAADQVEWAVVRFNAGQFERVASAKTGTRAESVMLGAKMSLAPSGQHYPVGKRWPDGITPAQARQDAAFFGALETAAEARGLWVEEGFFGKTATSGPTYIYLRRPVQRKVKKLVPRPEPWARVMMRPAKPPVWVADPIIVAVLDGIVEIASKDDIPSRITHDGVAYERMRGHWFPVNTRDLGDHIYALKKWAEKTGEPLPERLLVAMVRPSCAPSFAVVALYGSTTAPPPRITVKAGMPRSARACACGRR